ncbi:MAG: flavin reductase [Mycoplasmoidaceae bacterium]
MKQIKIKDIKVNPFNLIGNGWMVISAGDNNAYNMMTASWGHLGALWGHSLDGNPTAEIFVRPTRYTNKFIKKSKYFVLSFFDHNKYKKDLLYIGSHSGKDGNKIKHTKLHVIFQDNLPCFKEACLTLICKKIYVGKIKKAGFINKKIISEFYNDKSPTIYNKPDWHDVYIGEVVKAFKN